MLLGDLRKMTALFLWSTPILLIIAVKPILTEVGTSANFSGKAIKDGEEVGSQLLYPGARISNLFGLAGSMTLLLAFNTLIIG